MSEQDNDEYLAPPIRDLDFSEFHPLFHGIFSRECTTYYGGRRQHLYILWEYKWDVHTRVRRPLCWIGQHDWMVGWRPKTRTRSVHCRRCMKKPTAEQIQAALDESDRSGFYPPGWKNPRKET